MATYSYRKDLGGSHIVLYQYCYTQGFGTVRALYADSLAMGSDISVDTARLIRRYLFEMKAFCTIAVL